MSVHIQSLVYSRKFGGPTQKLVALKLADYANDDGGSIYPSQARLAAECEITDRQVRNILANFLERGLLRKVSGAKGGRKITVVYAFEISAVRALPLSFEGNPENISAFPRNPEIHDTKPGNLRPKTRKPISDNPSLTIKEKRAGAREPVDNSRAPALPEPGRRALVEKLLGKAVLR